MMFKKGSFEIGATVYPVAIKVSVRSYFYLQHVILTMNIHEFFTSFFFSVVCM